VITRTLEVKRTFICGDWTLFGVTL